MTLPIMISLYFRIETTASRRLFHYHIYVLLPWIKLIHWQQNGLLISIEGNIRVIYFKPIQIIGWWNDKQSFINWNICIMEIITNIQYPCSNYIHRCYKSFDPELISMWYWNIRLIKINDLDMRTSICRALCKKNSMHHNSHLSWYMDQWYNIGPLFHQGMIRSVWDPEEG